MTVNDTTTKNAILQAIKDAVGAGGTITIRDSTPATLVTLTAVTFGTPSGGSMTFDSTIATNAATGTKNDAQVKTSGGTTIVTLLSAEITVTNSIVAGGTTDQTGGTITI